MGLGEMAKAGTKTKKSKDEWQPLLDAARAECKNAHAPYSNFKVGAAFRTRAGEIFTGCNVENASYGMSNCAERTAIFSAVAKLGPSMEIEAIAVACEQDVPCSPCGACRQVIYEFGPRAKVYFQTARGWKESSIAELLPEGFRLKG
jgi:cytidine deaminase